MTAYKLQDTQHGIDVPPLVWRKPVRGDSNLGSHHRLELVISNFEECE